GITEMTWTFDPLRAQNANFNFTRLGVSCDAYLPNFYGNEATSSLHQHGTGRLWVCWRLKRDPVIERLAGRRVPSAPRQAEPPVTLGENERPVSYEVTRGTSANAVSIEIPTRIGEIERRDKELAENWRTATRQAFLGAFSAGFFVSGFFRDGESGTYQLFRKDEGEYFRGGRGRI